PQDHDPRGLLGLSGRSEELRGPRQIPPQLGRTRLSRIFPLPEDPIEKSHVPGANRQSATTRPGLWPAAYSLEPRAQRAIDVIRRIIDALQSTCRTRTG